MIRLTDVVTLLEIFDMPKSLAFYRDLLGFEIVASAGGDWAMLKLGEVRLMLNTRYEAQDRPAAPDQSRVAAHDDTELYFQCENVDETYTYLRSKGLDIGEPKIVHYGMKQLTVIDPDGFKLVFQHEVET